jgi:dolichol-phosphate mannosyltransferase
MTSSKEISLVVIPVINEYDNISVLLPRILKNYVDTDVLLIDDASTDETFSFVGELQKRYKNRMLYILNQDSLGIGGAHLQGLRYASENNYDFAVTMDGDLTHDPVDIQRLIHKMINNPQLDLVIGSRFLPGSRINGWSFLRILLTHAGHLFTRVTLQMKPDLSSGLRIYKVNSIPSYLLSIRSQIGYEYFALSAYTYKLEAKNISEIDVEIGRAHV